MDLIDTVVDAIERLVEVELGKAREKTRLMEESLTAKRAALEAKEREKSMLLREKDRLLALKDAETNLVADFFEADANKNFDEQKAMMDDIVALMSRDGGDAGIEAGGFGCVCGGNIIVNYLENTKNLDDEGAVMTTIEGITNGDGGVIATSNGGGHGGGCSADHRE